MVVEEEKEKGGMGLSDGRRWVRELQKSGNGVKSGERIKKR